VIGIGVKKRPACVEGRIRSSAEEVCRTGLYWRGDSSLEIWGPRYCWLDNQKLRYDLAWRKVGACLFIRQRHFKKREVSH